MTICVYVGIIFIVCLQLETDIWSFYFFSRCFAFPGTRPEGKQHVSGEGKQRERRIIKRVAIQNLCWEGWFVHLWCKDWLDMISDTPPPSLPCSIAGLHNKELLPWYNSLSANAIIIWKGHGTSIVRMCSLYNYATILVLSSSCRRAHFCLYQAIISLQEAVVTRNVAAPFKPSLQFGWRWWISFLSRSQGRLGF